jgi:hypothetical protein
MKEGIMKRVVFVVLLAVLAGLGAGCKDKEAQAALAEMKAQAELEARNIELVKTMIAELDKGNSAIAEPASFPTVAAVSGLTRRSLASRD